MNLGDPKKSAVLVVVALVVLGVAVVRIIPKSESSPSRSPTEAAGPEAAAAKKIDTSLDLRGDPFYHPALEADARTSVDPGRAPQPGGQDGFAPITLPSTTGFGGIPNAWLGPVGAAPKTPEAGSKPAENTGPDQQVKQKKKVTVNAVMAVAKPLAYVAVDGEEFKVGVGDQLPGVGTVVVITQRSVTVDTGHGKQQLLLGQEVEL